MIFLFFPRDFEKKVKKDTLARHFSFFAGGAFGECCGCRFALGYPFVHGNSSGRGRFFACAMAGVDGYPFGAPLCVFRLENERF